MIRLPAQNRWISGLLFAIATPALAGWESRFAAGERHLAARRFSDANVEYQAALREALTAQAASVDLAKIWGALGVTEYALGNARKAKYYLLKVLQVTDGVGAPVDVTSLRNAGKIYLELGELGNAERCFRKALEIDPSSSQSRHNLGQVLMGLKQYDAAETQFREALRGLNSPQARAAVLGDLCTLFLVKKDLPKATEAIEEAVRVAPKGRVRARVLTNRARVYFRTGRLGDAETDLRAASSEMEAAVGSSHPDVSEILFEYAGLLRRTGRKAESEQIARRAKQIEAAFTQQTNADRATVDWRDLK